MADQQPGVAKIEVKVARLPGTVVRTAILEGSTVAEALKGAKLKKKRKDAIQVNGNPAELTTKLQDGDFVTLVKDISGNE